MAASFPSVRNLENGEVALLGRETMVTSSTFNFGRANAQLRGQPFRLDPFLRVDAKTIQIERISLDVTVEWRPEDGEYVLSPRLVKLRFSGVRFTERYGLALYEVDTVATGHIVAGVQQFEFLSGSVTLRVRPGIYYFRFAELPQNDQ